MADGQDGSQGTQAATGATGGDAGNGQQTAQVPKTYTEADMQREADRRVTEAQKKWSTEQAAALADKTKDADTKIAELSATAAEAQRYADFVEAAHAAGVRNTKAAYAVAKHNGYFDSKGRFDVATFKTDNPEFFASVTANANAGAGAGAATNQGGMNAWIRQAAGR